MTKSSKSKSSKRKRTPITTVSVLVVVAILGIVLLVFGIRRFTNTTKPAQKDSTQQTQNTVPFSPYTATFQIIINGESRTFTDPRYHNQSADVYISPEGSRQVKLTVAKPNVTWGDFFKTLPMSVSNDCIITGTKQTFCTNASRTLRFYINNVENPNALSSIIEPSAQLKIVY